MPARPAFGGGRVGAPQPREPTLASTQSNLVADRRIADHPAGADRRAPDGRNADGRAAQGAARARSVVPGGRGGAAMSLFRMSAAARLGLVLIPLALLWAAILSLVT